ncbi:MAG: hypothetical protein OXE96_02570 [Gemmatimonadetes bacterium]|nr:hypothetical protein [Gemmatimonadota bacterium]
MTCPDLSDLARVGTPRADPAVVEHLQTCHSCWLDWQIQQGARYLHTGMRNDPQDLNQRVMAGITEMARQSDGPAGWGQLSLFGLLTAVALLIFFIMRMGGMATVATGNMAILAGASAIAAIVYCWRRDREADSGAGSLTEPDQTWGMGRDGRAR